MKKLLFVVTAVVSVAVASAQEKKSKTGFMNRSGDHIMLQISNDNWLGAPDSIKNRSTGISRGANIYVMMDKRFKSSKKMSVAFGIGVGTSNMYFEKMSIDLKSRTNTLPFRNLDSSDRFKKYKMTTAFLEAPLELRYIAKPDAGNKTLKAAIGVKVGTMINVHTKGKNLQDKNGSTLNSYTAKENAKGFMNTTRLAATARVGYGIFSLFGSYQLNNIFKDGVAPNMQLLQVGFAISGL